MHDSPAHLAIIRTILAFSTSLGLDAVAEGIELSSQRKQLLDLGCDYGQGYYFSKPLPAAQVPAFLTRRLPARTLDLQRSPAQGLVAD
jgi:EAL domain-containing protein (putative c-di-GMP-specific phosphodiesterase class I)